MVPSELFVGLDLRVTPKDAKAVEDMLQQWCKECDVTFEYQQAGVTTSPTLLQFDVVDMETDQESRRRLE